MQDDSAEEVTPHRLGFNTDIRPDADGKIVYEVTLHDRGANPAQKISFGSGDSVEAALAVVLDDAKTKLEAYKTRKLASLNQVLEKHGGVIRGARSKIRGG